MIQKSTRGILNSLRAAMKMNNADVRSLTKAADEMYVVRVDTECEDDIYIINAILVNHFGWLCNGIKIKAKNKLFWKKTSLIINGEEKNVYTLFMTLSEDGTYRYY